MPALLERLQPCSNKFGFLGFRPGFGKILLEISDRRVGVPHLRGDFTQHSAGAVRGGECLEDLLVVGLRGVQAANSHTSN